MIQESIYNYLIGKSDLTAYIGVRLYWPTAPDDATYPLVTYKVISAPHNYQLDDEWQRWRFFIFAEDPFDVDSISTLLKNYLTNLYGTVDADYIDFISRIDESSVDYRVDDKIHYKYIDFRVIYH